jgi:hypothetical protein
MNELLHMAVLQKTDHLVQRGFTQKTAVCAYVKQGESASAIV